MRTAYIDDVARLVDAGADRVVSAEVESAAQVIRQILEGHGADTETVARQLERVHTHRTESL